MTRVVYSAQNLYKRYPPPFRQMERYVLNHADLALAVSEDVVSVLRKKQYKGRHMLFPLGVDTEQFQPNKLMGRLQRVTCGIREHGFVVGFVGRFVEIKGISLILDAIARCEDPDITYVLVGTGPLLPEVLNMQAKRPDKLYVATNVAHREVQHWMNMMDVLLLPSITLDTQKEQFGRVIVEANACGVPVIGSTSGEIPRLIHTTSGGWVVPENDAKALREKIIYVKSHVEERYAAAAKGLEYVRQHLSKNAIASKLSMILSEISRHEITRKEVI